jgi:glycosyltransferase involved in cell wall biosynthesis
MNWKILVFADVHQGGEWHSNQRLFSGIKKEFGNKIDISLIGFRSDPYLKIEGFNKINLINHTTYAGKPFSYAKKLLLDFKIIRREIIKYLEDNNDIKYIWCTYYLAVLACYGLKNEIKIIYNFQGLRGHVLKNFAKNLNYSSLLTTLLETLALNLSEIIIVPSYFAKKLIEGRTLPFGTRFSKKNIYTIPNTVSSIYFVKRNATQIKKFKLKLVNNVQSKIIIYSGRIAKGKGIENLITAFQTLSYKHKNIYLIFAHPSLIDDQNIAIKIKKAVKDNKNIIEIINPGPKLLVGLYQISDILVLASDSEMAPLSVLEALACGTPVIGTSTGNIPELLNKIDKNFLLENIKSTEIAKKIEYVFHLPEKKLIKIHKSCKETAKHYTTNKSINIFGNLIDTILI